MIKRHTIVTSVAGLVLFVGLAATSGLAAAQGRGGRGDAAAPDPTKPQRLEISTGSKARYRVREQLAGINFPNDAVGTTEAVTGVIVINADGSITPESKLTVDLRTLSSDQSMRDGYIQTRTLETEQFPLLEFVPTRTVGLAAPIPTNSRAQAGFQLVGDMTLHGVTKEVTWNVIATFGNTSVAGSATTTLEFATFNLTKPSLARLVSVADKIQLEIEFRCTRTAAGD